MEEANNLHYTHTEATVFGDSGELLAGQVRKYAPKVRAIQRLLGPRRDLAILDVGTGYGPFLHLLQQEGYSNLAGMDPFAESLDIARRHTSAELGQGRIEDEQWPVGDRRFDVIGCFDVVEHLADPAVFFRRCREYLAPRGLVLLSTPNRSVFYEMRRLPIVGIPDWNPTHINVRRPRYWTKLARRQGYQVVEKWCGEVMAHVRYLPQLVEVLGKFLDFDLEKVWFLRGLQQSFCLVLRRP